MVEKIEGGVEERQRWYGREKIDGIEERQRWDGREIDGVEERQRGW